MSTRMLLTALVIALALGAGTSGNAHVPHPVRADETGWIVVLGNAH